MSETCRIACAQMDFMVGDVNKNTNNVIAWSQQAQQQGADLILFPELTLVGYPPEDLLLRQELFRQVAEGIKIIQREVKDIIVVIGYPELENNLIYNSAIAIYNGEIIGRYRKQCLPNYTVFDEKRYFCRGTDACIINLKNKKIAITICEDLWQEKPMKQAVENGADIILSLNASPYHQGKDEERVSVLKQRIAENHQPIIYVHWVGGQDEFIFDGGSMALNRNGEIAAHAGFFKEKLLIIEVEDDVIKQPIPSKPPHLEMIYQALVIGVRDYILKNNGKGALVGLSGGIDSALTLTIAHDALGHENVEAVLMPSRYTADMSNEDAMLLAQNLNIKATTISIENCFNAFLDSLAPRFAGLEKDVTEENLQSRIRGTLLMAISNKTNRLVLTTGNKSETAVGYSTLYGDTAGAFGVLKDVPKTLVYQLCEWRNNKKQVIPERIITRPPSAELSPNQTDQDTLPDYDTLDKIIEYYVEQDRSSASIVALGFDFDTVQKVIAMIDRNEYKRRQTAPGVRISKKAFGRDRRYPITSGFRSRLKKD